MDAQPPIIPVILSGGAGTRLWPMSTHARPKQFLPLTGEKSMFQLTLARVADVERFAPPIIVGSARHTELMQEQLASESISPGAIILEPCARNTAPAVALAALLSDPGAILLVLPSDHAIAKDAAFQAAIATALPFATQGWLVTFGIAASGPETGYGYIQCGAKIGTGCQRVLRFREKPDLAGAREMLKEGNHVWNGGIFMFRAGAYLAELSKHAPDMLAAAQAAFERAHRDGTLLTPDADAFAACPSNSIDYAVMEKADRVAVVPVNMGWSDVGSWDALYGLNARDEAQNAVSGDVRLLESWGNLVQSDGIRISAHGINDLIIIASGNEVMILPRGQSQNAKKLAK